MSGNSKKVRADAQRSLDALLQSAKEVFVTSGVDAPVREIAEKAGVGLGTVYRHFPQRADLIAAVARHEIDACADAASLLSAQYDPGKALTEWIKCYAGFIATKKGLAPALHSGDPTYEKLRSHFEGRVFPACSMLLQAAIAAGVIRDDANADDVLFAVAGLCMSAQDGDSAKTERLIALLLDGLRFGAKAKSSGE